MTVGMMTGHVKMGVMLVGVMLVGVMVSMSWLEAVRTLVMTLGL
jgi:hypothetical protein